MPKTIFNWITYLNFKTEERVVICICTRCIIVCLSPSTWFLIGFWNCYHDVVFCCFSFHFILRNNSSIYNLKVFFYGGNCDLIMYFPLTLHENRDTILGNKLKSKTYFTVGTAPIITYQIRRKRQNRYPSHKYMYFHFPSLVQALR